MGWRQDSAFAGPRCVLKTRLRWARIVRFEISLFDGLKIEPAGMGLDVRNSALVAQQDDGTIWCRPFPGDAAILRSPMMALCLLPEFGERWRCVLIPRIWGTKAGLEMSNKSTSPKMGRPRPLVIPNMGKTRCGAEAGRLARPGRLRDLWAGLRGKGAVRPGWSGPGSFPQSWGIPRQAESEGFFPVAAGKLILRQPDGQAGH